MKDTELKHSFHCWHGFKRTFREVMEGYTYCCCCFRIYCFCCRCYILLLLALLSDIIFDVVVTTTCFVVVVICIVVVVTNVAWVCLRFRNTWHKITSLCFKGFAMIVSSLQLILETILWDLWWYWSASICCFSISILCFQQIFFKYFRSSVTSLHFFLFWLVSPSL